MHRVVLGVLALATGCTPPADAPADVLALADGPDVTGSIDAIVEDLQRRATWVPDAPGVDGGAWVHVAGGTRAVFADRVVLMDAARDTWQVDFELTGFGRTGALEPTPILQTSASGHRVTVDRGAVVEWFDDLGTTLEHGLELSREPGGAGPVVVQLAVAGDLVPRGSGERVELVDHDGQVRVVLDTLRAWDVDGDPVPAHMQTDCDALGGCVARYVLDDRHADWPISVDPVLHSLLANGSFAGSPGYAGYDVDVSNDRAIVSVPGDPSSEYEFGWVYLLERNVGGADAWGVELAVQTANLVSFGHSVAIDGDVAVIGAPAASVVHVYEHSGSAWNSTPEVLSMPGERFGASVDVSGEHLVVGAPNYSGTQAASGRVYAFERGAVDWGSQQSAVAPVPEGLEQHFGSTVALDDRTLLVGIPGPANMVGRAVLFQRDDSGVYGFEWELPVLADPGEGVPVAGVAVGGRFAAFSDPVDSLELYGDAVRILDLDTLPNPTIYDLIAPPNALDFGARIATDGRTLAVAAREDSTAGGPQARVWLYEETGSGWGIVADFEVPTSGGWVPDVAIDDGLLVIGEPGMGVNGRVSVYRQEGGWVQSTFSPSDGVNATLGGSRAGAAVAVSGDRVAIGLPDDGVVASSAGRVILLDRVEGVAPGWSSTGTLLADPFAGPDQRFGAALSMHGEWVAVGAPGVGGSVLPANGAAHLFQGTSPVFSLTGSLSQAGSAVAVGPDVFVVGMPGADQVEIVRPVAGGWSSVNTLTGSGGFGQALDIDGHWLIVGSPSADWPFQNAGAVTAFDLAGSDGTFVNQAFGDGVDLRLGASVAVTGDVVFAGLPGPVGSTTVGEVHRYALDASGLTYQDDLVLVAPTAGDRWGFSLDASGDRLLVGSRGDRVAIHERNSGGADAWGQGAYEPVPTNLSAGEDFGYDVAIDGRTAAIGSPERGPAAKLRHGPAGPQRQLSVPPLPGLAGLGGSVPVPGVRRRRGQRVLRGGRHPRHHASEPAAHRHRRRLCDLRGQRVVHRERADAARQRRRPRRRRPDGHPGVGGHLGGLCRRQALGLLRVHPSDRLLGRRHLPVPGPRRGLVHRRHRTDHRPGGERPPGGRRRHLRQPASRRPGRGSGERSPAQRLRRRRGRDPDGRLDRDCREGLARLLRRRRLRLPAGPRSRRHGRVPLRGDRRRAHVQRGRRDPDHRRADDRDDRHRADDGALGLPAVVPGRRRRWVRRQRSRVPVLRSSARSRRDARRLRRPGRVDLPGCRRGPG